MADDWIPLSAFDRVTEELRAFADGAPLTETDDAVRVAFENARVEVTRDGRVEAGMPLHDLAAVDATAVAVDHEAGELRVRAEGVAYTIRRP
jgi:hypothetical protein